MSRGADHPGGLPVFEFADPQGNPVIMLPSRHSPAGDTVPGISFPYEITLKLERTKLPIFPESRREPPYPRNLVITLYEPRSGRAVTPDFELSRSPRERDAREGGIVPFFFHELK